MYVSVLRLELRIRDGPRAKRRTVRTIVNKIHRHFNVSIAEVDRIGHPSESVIGVATVALGRREAREILDRVADALISHPRVEILGLEISEL